MHVGTYKTCSIYNVYNHHTLVVKLADESAVAILSESTFQFYKHPIIDMHNYNFHMQFAAKVTSWCMECHMLNDLCQTANSICFHDHVAIAS